jgi:putative glutamine amidotransferase
VTPVVALSARNMDGLPGIKAGMTAALLTHDYLLRVQEAGAIPVMLPPIGALPHAILDRVDGLLLTGGEDVEPAHYGQGPSPKLGAVDPLRDALELGLAAEAARRGMPVLAICRGLQVLNVALGGTLVQDLPSERPSEIAHRQEAPSTEPSHPVTLAPESRLAELAGTERLMVNSFHHQAAAEVAPRLRAVAWAEDGVIEALEGTEGFMLGLQWHPECQKGEFAGPLFAAFAEACRKYAEERQACSLV